jgi:predicted restriction endonuclease
MVNQKFKPTKKSTTKQMKRQQKQIKKNKKNKKNKKKIKKKITKTTRATNPFFKYGYLPSDLEINMDLQNKKIYLSPILASACCLKSNKQSFVQYINISD